jgi:hypothetical protein
VRRQPLEVRPHLLPRGEQRRVIELGEVGGFLGCVHWPCFQRCVFRLLDSVPQILPLSVASWQTSCHGWQFR